MDFFDEMQAEYNAYYDYQQEAFGPTALDAAICGAEDAAIEAFENGFSTEEELRAQLAKIRSGDLSF